MKPPLPHGSDRRRERLREKALDLGFVACGFTGAGALGNAELLADWVARGRHGDMEYLARDLASRDEPRRTLGVARSVIVAAWPYEPQPERDDDWAVGLRGKIAAYARGVDYHALLPVKLEVLAAAVRDTYGGSTIAHVDAGPLVEKSLARRAGLGWYGRNTNLLLPVRGSYVLLGCLLCEAEIEPDAPFLDDHCGTCNACVPACPTGALDDGPTIDARLCIAYLTIEHRGPIRHDLRPLIGGWVFGCDDCQSVCPWNDSAVPSDAWLRPGLDSLLLMTREEFADTYRSTAVARTKRRGLARNAAVVLGNTANPAAVPLLAEALARHDEALVRAHSAWALGRLGGRDARAALQAAAVSERVEPVLFEIGLALNAMGGTL